MDGVDGRSGDGFEPDGWPVVVGHAVLSCGRWSSDREEESIFAWGCR
jgi:hypothetical protein